MRDLLSNTYNKFLKTDERSRSVLKNVGFGFLSRGVSVFLSFLQIPITLSILRAEQYGVWLTIFSITNWFLFFDFGFGHGLRNKLTEALSEKDYFKAKKYISTTYFALLKIFGIFCVLFSVVAPFLSWQKILNAPLEISNSLLPVLYISFFSTILNFIAGLIHVVIAAHQQIGKSNIILLVNQLLLLGVTLVIKFLKIDNAFLYVSIVLATIPWLTNVAISLFYYNKTYKHLKPSISCYDASCKKEILNLGIKFFIIQISLLVIFATDNIIIAQLFTPVEVTNYNIVYKYFSVMIYAFNVISAPLWTMYTDAYKKGEISWINNNVRKMLYLFFVFTIGTILMILLSGFAFKMWIGPDFTVSFLVLLLMGIYVLQNVWNNIFVIPLNSIGNLNWQVYASIFAVLSNIPLAILFSKVFHNITAIILANIACLLLNSIWSVIMYRKSFLR